jgi:hypothetical protein
MRHTLLGLASLLLCTSGTASAATSGGAIKNGIAIAWPITAQGNLHLQLHERNNPDKRPLRWTRRLEPRSENHLRWSLGTVIKGYRTWDGQNLIRPIPRLQANMPWRGHRVYTELSYGQWSADGRRTPMDDPAVQWHLRLDWRR